MADTLIRASQKGKARASARLGIPQTLFLAPLALWFALSYAVRGWMASRNGESD